MYTDSLSYDGILGMWGSISLSSLRIIFPDGVRGISVINCTPPLSFLNGATRSTKYRQKET